MTKKDIPKALLLLFLIVDTGISFYQHTHFPLDGDMASVILFKEGYSKALQDPFGISVITENSIHAAPNRFFAHLNMSMYFKTFPFAFQYFTNPIDSIYYACGFAKTSIQLLMIFMFAYYITRGTNVFNKDFLLAAVLVTPLFQAYGFNGPMGIIDKSTTYTFFYALPLSLLSFFFFPFFKANYSGEKIKFTILQSLFLLLLIVTLSLNGPLVPGVVLIICPIFLVHKWYFIFCKEQNPNLLKRVYLSILKISGPLLFYFTLFSLTCLYSLYIGKNNIENYTNTIPLLERYARLPIGLFHFFTSKLGPPLLLIFILTNAYIIKNSGDHPDKNKILNLLKWVGIFALIYTILLPLGGYREYRENIIRRDTYMPVVLGLVFIYGISTFFILKHIAFSYKKIYWAGLVLFLFIFTLVDKPLINDNSCERDSLEKIARSTQKITLIENDCSVIWWGKLKNPEYSKTNAILMKYWNITTEEKLYYQR